MTKPAKPNNLKKEFTPSIGFWPTKKGNGYSVFLDQRVMGEIQKAQEGGRLFLQAVESDNEKAPAYRVSILPPDDRSANPPTGDTL